MLFGLLSVWMVDVVLGLWVGMCIGIGEILIFEEWFLM